MTGKLLAAPRKGAVVVIEFPDGLHEYVTTPVRRVLRLADRDVFYIETANSRYKLHLSQIHSAAFETSSSIDSQPG